MVCVFQAGSFIACHMTCAIWTAWCYLCKLSAAQDVHQLSTPGTDLDPFAKLGSTHKAVLMMRRIISHRACLPHVRQPSPCTHSGRVMSFSLCDTTRDRLQPDCGLWVRHTWFDFDICRTAHGVEPLAFVGAGSRTFLDAMKQGKIHLLAILANLETRTGLVNILMHQTWMSRAMHEMPSAHDLSSWT